MDFSVFKSIPITEKIHGQFRVEIFNLLNRANFNLPNIFFGTPTFGAIQSAQTPRRIQFGAKILF